MTVGSGADFTPTILPADIGYDNERFERRDLPDEIIKQIPKVLAGVIAQTHSTLKEGKTYNDVCRTANGNYTVFFNYYADGSKIGIIRINRRK